MLNLWESPGDSGDSSGLMSEHRTSVVENQVLGSEDNLTDLPHCPEQV